MLRTEEKRAALGRALSERRIRPVHERRAAFGFAGVSCSLADAVALARELAGTGFSPVIVEDRYRTPRVSRDTAVAIAAEHIRDVVQRKFPDEQFGSMRFVRETPLWWTFFAPSDTLIGKGHVPGGVFCNVDKCDGTVMDAAGQERAYQLMYSWRST